jgi:hypothetical protein
VDLVDNLILQKTPQSRTKPVLPRLTSSAPGAKPATVPSLRIARTTRTSSLKVNFGLMFRSPETVADSSPRAVFAPAARARGRYPPVGFAAVRSAQFAVKRCQHRQAAAAKQIGLIGDGEKLKKDSAE